MQTPAADSSAATRKRSAGIDTSVRVCVCVSEWEEGRSSSEIYSDPPSALGSGQGTVERDDAVRLVAGFDLLQVIGCFVFL